MSLPCGPWEYHVWITVQTSNWLVPQLSGPIDTTVNAKSDPNSSTSGPSMFVPMCRCTKLAKQTCEVRNGYLKDPKRKIWHVFRIWSRS